MPLLLAAAAWGLVKARLSEPPRTRYATAENLVQSFLFGELVWPTERLNFGSPRGQRHAHEADPRRRSQAHGLLTRPGGRPPFALVVGTEAVFDLDVITPTERRLVLRLAAVFTDREQEVRVAFNGRELGRAMLRRDGQASVLRFPVPALDQERGSNFVSLTFDDTESIKLHDLPMELPLSARLISAAFLLPGQSENLPPPPLGRIRAGVTGELGTGGETRKVLVPAGSSVRVSTRLPQASRVVLRYRAERVDTSLELSLLTDDGQRTVLSEIDPRDVVPREVMEDLSPWAGKVVQFDFWARAGAGRAEISALGVLVPEDEAPQDKVTEGEAPEADEPGSDGQRASPPGLPSDGPPGPRGLLVVVLDAMARERSSLGGDRDSTPVLARLARRSLVAPDAEAPASYTLASVGSLLSGLPPMVHGVLLGETAEGPQRLPADAPSLARQLSAAGWRTAAWLTNPNTSSRHGYNAGFEQWEELFADPDLWRPGVGVDGSLLAPRLAGFLARDRERPFLAWVHVFEPHAPWRAPDDLTAAFVGAYQGSVSGERKWLDAYRTGAIDPASVGDDDFAHLGDLYAARLALADRVLGSLLDVLGDSGRSEDTAILVISDHGEALGEHGRLEHGDDVHVEQVAVPFVLFVPGVAPRTLSGPVSLLDVMPTLLGLAGLEAPAELDGVDLLAREVPEDRPRLTRSYGTRPSVGLEQGRWCVQFDSFTRRLSLYDREADPEQRQDLSGRLPVTAGWMRAELCRQVAAAATRVRARVRGTDESGEVDPEQLAQLQSLGYVGSGEEQAQAVDDALLLALRSRLVRD